MQASELRIGTTWASVTPFPLPLLAGILKNGLAMSYFSVRLYQYDFRTQLQCVCLNESG